jgi:hypothetical protein
VQTGAVGGACCGAKALLVRFSEIRLAAGAHCGNLY